MLEQMIRRQLRVMRLALVAGWALAVFGFLAPIAPNSGRMHAASFFILAAFAMTEFALLAYWCSRYRGWLLPLGPRPWATMREIDAEIDAGGDVRRFGDAGFRTLWTGPGCIVLTAGWLVRVHPHGIHAVKLNDMLWIFLTRRPASRWSSEDEAQDLR